MRTSKRHTILSELLESGQFDSQDDLLAELKTKGCPTTQATLSRDLKKLGAVKKEGRYTLGPIGYALDGFSKVTGMKYVEPNIILVTTTPGLAQAAGSMIDHAGIGGIAGSVAGDDTIMVIIESPAMHSSVLTRLSKLFSIRRGR